MKDTLRRILSITLYLLMVFALAACGGKGESSSEPSSVDVDTSAENSLEETPSGEVGSEETSSEQVSSNATSSRQPSSSNSTSTKPENPFTSSSERVSSAQPSSNEVSSEEEVPAPKPIAAQDLNNTVYKLKTEKKLTIGYLGGSVTDGYGASSMNTTSWRAFTTKWFKDTFSNATITEINAAIGGTGSYYGAARIQRDLLSKKPDLVFVEFAINDSYLKTSMTQSIAYMESIILQCYNANPNMDIVLVYTTDCSKNGADTTWTMAFDTIAQMYGLNVINVGNAMADTGAIADYFTSDGVHPNDKGYELIYKTVTASLKSYFSKVSGKALVKHAKPNKVSADSFTKTEVIDAAAMAKENPSIRKAGQTPNMPVDSLMIMPGQTITVTFEGNSVGAYWNCTQGTAAAKVTVDGEDAYFTVNSAEQKVFFENLSSGKHTITITTQKSGSTLYVGEILVTK